MGSVHVFAPGVPMSLDVLEAEICRWSANLTAAEADWLALIAEFDAREGYRVSGCSTCPAWMAWQLGIDLVTAREKVRVARVLVKFPAWLEAMRAGRITYAKLRGLTRIVNIANADVLLDFGLHQSSNEIERFVAAYRRSEPETAKAELRAFRDRSVSVVHDGATTVFTVRVPNEMGAVLVACVDEFVDHTDLTAGGLRGRLADAVVAMAEHAVATRHVDGDGDGGDVRYLATVHLTPDVFGPNRQQGEGVCAVSKADGVADDPVGVPLSTAERILCDCVLEGYVNGGDGNGGERLSGGKRTIPKRLKRALRLRDGGCRFPGCRHSAWVDAHHIVHWLRHGKTVEENLVCLCRRHHRLMHEGGWNVSGDPAGELFFHDPDGVVVPGQPVVVVGCSDEVEAYARSADQGRFAWQDDYEIGVDRLVDIVERTEEARYGKVDVIAGGWKRVTVPYPLPREWVLREAI